MRRCVTRVLAAAMVLAAVFSGAASAGAASWQRAKFGGTARLTAVSCRGASWCMAVGGYVTTDGVRHALAMTWNGTTWLKLKNPPGKVLTWVSCSGPSFCLAAGGPTGAERWTGLAWKSMTSPRGGVKGISCTTRTLCMMIYRGFVRSWNGTSWRLWSKQTDVCDGAGDYGPCGLSGVSCGSAANCVAVGTVTTSPQPIQIPVGVFWNGRTWAPTRPPGVGQGNPAAMNSVACAGTFCLAAGGAFSEVIGGDVAVAGTWDARAASWADVSPDLGRICTGFRTCSWADAISCGRAANCLTAGPAGRLWWDGSAWEPAPAKGAGPGWALPGSSCGTSTCLAVGHQIAAGKERTLAEVWDGSHWAIVPTPLGP